MSVLKRIQGKIGSVQQDLSDSLKSFRLKRLSSTNSSEYSVSLNAGSDILNRYQEIWFSIHSDIEKCAVSAQDAALKIGEIVASVEKQHNLLNNIYDELISIPVVTEEISNIHNSLDEIRKLAEGLDGGLIDLEIVCETLDMNKEMRRHQNQLEVYRLRRESDFESIKANLASQHSMKVQQFETRRQSELSERQTYFEEAFIHDVEFYKIFGQTERRPSNERYGVDLADISLDTDSTELDQFLETEEAAAKCDTDQKQEAFESEGDDSGVHDSPTVDQSPKDPADSKGDLNVVENQEQSAANE